VKKLFGVTNNNIAHLSHHIRAFRDLLSPEKKKKLRVQILDFEEKVRDTVNVLLVPSITLFNNNLRDINDSNAVVFVFGPPVRCEYLYPITLLDVQQKRNSFTYLFVPELTYEIVEKALLTGLRSPNTTIVDQRALDVIPTLLDETKGSIMQAIMSYLYKVPNTDKRQWQQSLIFSWLLSDYDEEQLYLALGTTKNKNLDKLVAFFNSELGMQSRAALKEVTELRRLKKPVIYKSMAKKYPKLDMFDLRYALKVYKRIRQNKAVDRELKDLFIRIDKSTEKKTT